MAEKHLWECSLCGCILEDDKTPTFCPLCEHESVFFIKTDSIGDIENEI